MTKENLFKSFLEDPLLVEKKYSTPEYLEKLQFIDPTKNKLLEVIKITITGIVAKESDGVTARKINQYLNNQ